MGVPWESYGTSIEALSRHTYRSRLVRNNRLPILPLSLVIRDLRFSWLHDNLLVAHPWAIVRNVGYALKRCVLTLYEAALYHNSMSLHLLLVIRELAALRLPNHHRARAGSCHCLSLPTRGNATSHDMNSIVDTQFHSYFRIANLGGSSVTEACGIDQIDRGEH